MKRQLNTYLQAAVFLTLALFVSAGQVFAQGSSFTYQGRLQDGGTMANGSYDFQFTLWDAANSGKQQPVTGPVTVTRSGVQVADGIFTTQLDFGADAFPGADRYLEIGVRLAGGGAFTILAPRQQISATPYAIRATNATQLGGVAASQYVQTNDLRLTDSRSPAPGSSNYIQNTALPQAATNFNISGTGTGSIFNAATQYNIGGNRVLSVAGTHNVFAGEDAGASNATGQQNSFFGKFAGNQNTIGNWNSFFGTRAGYNNTEGGSNSFFGLRAGQNNTTQSNNTLIGAETDASANVTNATAIGTRARVTRSNSLVLGSIANVNNGYGDTNVGIGTTAPEARLDIRHQGAGVQSLMMTAAGGFPAAAMAGVIGRNSGGTLAAPTAITNHSILLALEGSGHNGTGFENAVGISMEATENWTNAANGTGMNFVTTPNGQTGAYSRVTIEQDGNVGIGTWGPTGIGAAATNRLHVTTSINSTATPTNHVALIQNTSSGTSADVLALKIGRVTNPDSANNFITFFNGNDTSVGSIEGNGAGGVVLAGAGADYGEWLPQLDVNEKIQPGDVVGVFAGRISKVTNQASQVMVVSTGAIVAGNDPGTNARTTHSLVAFIGQAMVRVRGPVQAGDFIVPSGREDGVGIAVSPERITAEQFAQVLGQAWETSTSTGIKQVRVAVGLIRHDPIVKRLLAQSRQQAAQIGLLQEKTAQIGLLQEKMAELEARLVASERAMQIIAASSNKRRSTKTAGSQNSTAPASTLSVTRKAKLASTR